MITCEWRKSGRLLVEHDGQVYPCCYLSNTDYIGRVNQKDTEKYIMKKYREHQNELNILNNDIDEIMKHEWWKELENSWSDSSKCHPSCVKFCSNDT